MAEDDRIPVVVATGQAIEREVTVSPVELAARACESAFTRAPELRRRIDRLSMVNVLSGGGPAPASELADALGLSPGRREVTTVGGNSPQWLVSRSASAVASGEVDAVLIAGAEAQRSKRVLREQGSLSKSGSRRNVQVPPDPLVGDDRPGVGPAELAAGLVAPIHLYALFESAIAHRSGRTFAEQRTVLGELMAPFSEVAAKHPYAWFPQALSAAEISEISADNRLVSEPYPKRMCAVMQVDQAACAVVTSLAVARATGVSDEAIFCWSGADASDVWWPTARPDPGRSPAIAAAASAALGASGLDMDEVSAIDLYSCFPCVVELATEALGISARDGRGLTVTGGLPYFGGPGNDYTLHAIATMTGRLREVGGTALVTGLGWYATKHSIGVYGSSPPPSGWRSADTTSAQRAIDESAAQLVDLSEIESGTGEGVPVSATVIGSTLGIGRDGGVESAPVIARLDDGRQLAVAAQEVELESLKGRNLVGERVVVSRSPPRYRLEA